MARLRSWLRALLRRRRFEDAMTEELRFHIDAYTRDLVRCGVPPVEAARRARIEFGSVPNVMGDCREARGLRLLDGLQQDLRYAVRLMRRTPGVTATVLTTLALCLGANITIFAVVDSVLLRPLPFPDPDRLVSIYNTYPRAGVFHDGASLTNYYERRGQLDALSSVAAYRDGTAVVGEPGSTERVAVTRVTPDFFVTLGLGPAMGRAFTEAETRYDATRVVVLTDEFWRRHLGGDPDVVGRAIRLNGLETTVVGVLPERFSFLSSRAELYLPLASDPGERSARQRHSGNSDLIGRLAMDATLAQAQDQIDAHNARMESASGYEAQAMADAGFRSLVVPLHADHVAAVRSTLLLMQAGALFLLLIGVVNLVNLFLVRTSGRLKELAVRQAIGASRRHVVSEVVVETLLVTSAGGLLGLIVGALGIRLLGALGAEHLPLGARVAFDLRLGLVGLAGAILTGLAIAMPIVWYNLQGHRANALQSESRSSTVTRSARRMRHGFIVAQVALAFVLLAGTGLLALSLDKVMALSPGFRADHVLSGRLSLPGTQYRSLASVLAFTERLADALEQEPGVVAAGVATNVPFSGNSAKSAVTVKGYVRPAGQSPRGHYAYGVGGDYFAAMGFVLVEGRFLDANDSRRAARACVVDDDFARRYWPDRDAIGQQVFQGPTERDETEAFTVVGVVGGVRQAALSDNEQQGAVYFPFGYRADAGIFVVTRTSVAPESLGGALETVVRRIDPDLPVSDVRSMDALVSDSLVARRSPALFAALFSAIAVLMTAIGTYGVLSHAVAQRRREIGLRMALGARPEQVRRQFVAIAVRLLTAGAALGLAGAWLAGRAMQAVLFEVSATDPMTLGATAGILTVVCLTACLLPARRAARISPMAALSE